MVCRSRVIIYGFLAGLSLVSEASAQNTSKKEVLTKGTSKNKFSKQIASEQIVVKGSRALVTSAATKTSTPLIDTPQAVTVITRQDMDQRGVLSLNQALRYVAGVTPDLRGGSATRYDLYSLRGFTIPNFLDGLRQQGSPLGYAVPQVDTSRLDSIEVLKGPASALYGQSSPGGLVAMSSKLPTKKDSYGSLEATGGGYDLYRVDGDIGGSLTKNGFVRYRLYGTANGSHSQLTYTKNRRYSISPAITFGGDGPTTLTLLGNFQDDPKNNAYGGVPIKGSLYRASYGYIPQNFYVGDPNYEQFDRRHWAATYIFNHKFNKNWSFSTRGRHDDIHADYKSIYSTAYVDQTTVNRYAIFANERLSNYAFDSQIKGHFFTGPFEHDLMTGFDYQKSHATEVTGYGSVSAINLLSPVYGINFTRPKASAAYDIQSHQIGLYAQDQISYDGFHFTGSIRNDWYRSTQTNTLSNKTTPQSSEPITWRVAGLYHFKFGLAPYVSYSTSFQPQSGIVSDDGGKTTRQANPTRGKQLEGGVKYQIPGLPVLLTATGFHIEQTNVLTAVGNLGYSTESAKVHSDGFEFEAHADLTEGLSITAAVSRQKIRSSSTNLPLVGSGKGNASLFTAYTFHHGPLQGLGVGGGFRYVDQTYGGKWGTGPVYTPSYILGDAMLSYDFSHLGGYYRGLSIRASMRNLAGTRYVTNCMTSGTSAGWCWYGERRTGQVTVGYRW